MPRHDGQPIPAWRNARDLEGISAIDHGNGGLGAEAAELAKQPDVHPADAPPGVTHHRSRHAHPIHAHQLDSDWGGVVRRCRHAQGDAVVGGRRYAVAGAEYTHWFGESWGIAGFVDAGNAWDDTTLFKAVLGYGFGARFRTPIGPIRADLAYGQEVHSLRLHFSVGYTF